MKKRDKEIIIKNGKTKSIINKQAIFLTATNREREDKNVLVYERKQVV